MEWALGAAVLQHALQVSGHLRKEWVLNCACLRRNEPRRPTRRHGGVGSEWRTRLRLLRRGARREGARPAASRVIRFPTERP
jgi:hypothetical protein